MKQSSFLKYPGAKWALADWIISFIPKHHSYLEPFFGSGAVLFNKEVSNIETINDLDYEVVNLFECIRNDPEKIGREIFFTPYARQEYEGAHNPVPPDDLYRRACNFIIRCNMEHGFRTNGEKVGWKNDVQGREKSYALKYWSKLPEQVVSIAERLKQVQIENRPAVELITRFNYPNVLIYADPPYMLDTRYGKQYRHEMNERDHEELLNALRKHRGSVILSGYQTDLYDEMLQGWHKETKSSLTQTMTRKTEVLWMNFEPSRQMELTELSCVSEQ